MEEGKQLFSVQEEEKFAFNRQKGIKLDPQRGVREYVVLKNQLLQCVRIWCELKK